MRRVLCSAFAAVLVLGAAAGAAQQAAAGPTGGQSVSEDEPSKEPPPSAATRAYMDAAIEMHRQMNVHYTDDADRDFASTLEAHHKGAVEIAKVELQYGTDPEMRRLAEAVVRSREHEIALIRAWRAKHQ